VDAHLRLLIGKQQKGYFGNLVFYTSNSVPAQMISFS